MSDGRTDEHRAIAYTVPASPV